MTMFATDAITRGKDETMHNRFEQVADVVPDAITLVLAQRGDGQWATVACPKSAHASLTADRLTEAAALVERESLLGVAAGEQPLALALGDERRLEERVRLGALVADCAGELERLLGVATRGIPVAAKLMAT